MTRGGAVLAVLVAALFAPVAAAQGSRGLVLDTQQLPWEQVARDRQFILHSERERYTNLDGAGRFVMAVEVGRQGPALAELRTAWRIERDGRTIASDETPIARGLVSVDLDLRRLEPGRYDLRAELRHGGQVLEERATFFRVEHVEPPARSGRVKLIFPRGVEPGAAGVAPVSLGVPFPKGALPATPSGASRGGQPGDGGGMKDVRVVDAQGKPVPARFAVRSRWGHGEASSVRWLGVDLQAGAMPAYWPGRSAEGYYLEFGDGIESPEPAQRVRVAETPEGLRVDTGPLRFLVRRDGFNLLDEVTLHGQPVLGESAKHGPYLVDHEGATYRAANDRQVELSIEEAGPMQVTLRAEGWYVKDGTDGAKQHYALPTDKLCKFVTRIVAYAGQPQVRVLHTWVLTYDSYSVRLKDVGLSLPLRGARAASFGVEGGETIEQPVSDAGVYLLQHRAHRFDVMAGGAAVASGKHSDGSAVVRTPQGLVGIAHREMWQRYPKEIEVTPEAVTMHVWPAHGRELDEAVDPLAHDQVHKMWFAHAGQELDLQMPWDYYLAAARIADDPGDGVYEPAGMAMAGVHSSAMGTAITTDMTLRFAPVDQQQAMYDGLAAFQARPLALPEPRWLADSGALGTVHPYDPARYPRIEEAIERTLRGYRAIQDGADEYGMWVYRAWHHNTYHGDGTFDIYRLYNATHHHEAYMPWLMYARSGDPFYFDQGIANVRLLTDVQVLHYDDPDYPHREYHFGQGRLVGSTKHTNGWAPWGGDHAVFGHLTCYNGILTAYYLTGDPRLREVVVDEWQQTILEDRANPEFAGASRIDRPGRDNNNSLGELIDLYQLTYDPRLLAWIGPATQRFYDDMKIWGMPLEKVLAFSGDSRVRQQLIDACLAARQPGQATHTLFTGVNHASVFAMAALLEPDAGFATDAFFRLDVAGLMQWVQQVQPDGPTATLYQVPDQLIYLPRILAAMAQADDELDPQQLDRPQAFPLAAMNRSGYSPVVLREDQDRAFDIHLRGTIGADGMDVQVFGPDSQLVQRTQAPGNTAERAAPFTITVPADGKTGQYVVLLGAREGQDELSVPLTDLPGEVYPRGYWMQTAATRFFTRTANAEGGQIAVQPHKGKARLSTADFSETLASTDTGEYVRATMPDAGVWIEMTCRYVHMADNEPITLAVSPSRWFEPAPDKLTLTPAP